MVTWPVRLTVVIMWYCLRPGRTARTGRRPVGQPKRRWSEPITVVLTSSARPDTGEGAILGGARALPARLHPRVAGAEQPGV